jgi:hypothetical protein
MLVPASIPNSNHHAFTVIAQWRRKIAVVVIIVVFVSFSHNVLLQLMCSFHRMILTVSNYFIKNKTLF